MRRHSSPQKRYRNRRTAVRRGAALIEFSICLPFLLFILLVSMCCTNFIFLRQALVQSAYEGAKVAIDPTSNQATARARMQAVLDGRNVKNARISFSPSRTDTMDRGEEVQVTVTAPSNGNLLFNLPGFQNRTVTVTSTMIRE